MGYDNKVHASATDSAAVTPSDSTELEFDALYIGSGGAATTVVVKHTATGAAVTYNNVPTGSILPVKGVRVMAASSATGIVAMRW